METLNKKTLLHIFLGFVFIQASVLLAISANFLLAQTNEITTTPDYNTTEYTTTDNIIDNSTTYDYPTDSTIDYPTMDDGSDNITKTDSSINDITTAPLTLTFLERLEPPLSGDQRISVISNQEIFSCVFKVYGPKYAEFSGIKDGPANCHIILQTKNFLDGYYTIKAVAGNNIGTAEIRLDAEIENQTMSDPNQPPTAKSVPTEPFYPIEPIPTEPIPTLYSDQPTPDSSATKPYYQEPAYVQPEQPVIKITPECQEKGFTAEECLKYNQFPPECKDQGVNNQEECDQLMKNLFRLTFECKNANIVVPEECENYMTKNFMPDVCKEKGITTKQECDYLIRNSYNDSGYMRVDANPSIINNLIFEDEELPQECKEKNISSFEECERYLKSINMPEECRNQNIASETECEKVMFKNYAPKECVDAGITSSSECEKFMFKEYAPDDCRQAGIFNPEACKKFMFEKYGGGENIPVDKFPIECKKAGAKTIEKCEKIMQKTYLPKECADEGLKNEQECVTYLEQKHMPKECLEASAKSRQECDKIMFKKFGPPECKTAGIDDEKECEEFILDKYAPKINCGDIEDWKCKNSIKERYLGNIVAKQTVFNKINEKKEEITGKSMKAEDPRMGIVQEEKMYPIVTKNIGIKIIATNESIVLDEKDNLIQTAPIAFMIDSDEDGLPDDMEKRFGTDPFKADTDEDGYSDGEEIKNGNNPLGEGKFETELAPIEKALMGNRPLGHPATEGKEMENFSVKNISNMEDAQGNLIEGYMLSGKTSPDSVATLYIYSDLPIIVTVNADQYGNWNYQLDQSLVDGEHEIYIAINDDTGKVIEKSKPLNFFIKKASAVSVKDFVSVAKASSAEPKESEVSIYYYLLITLFMAIAGIFIFLAVIISRKKKQPL